MNSKTSHAIKNRENPNDVFYTPPELARYLTLRLMRNLSDANTFLDPCAGKNAFYDNFPQGSKKYRCEITDGIDFFDFNKTVDWCISNPPYSKLDTWLQHTCEITKRGFAYLIGLHNLTPKRIEMCNNLGFYIAYVEIMKVFKWYGMSAFVVFIRVDSDPNIENVIEYNRKIWR